MMLRTASVAMALVFGVLSVPLRSEGQSAKIARIGWLKVSTGLGTRGEAFMQGLGGLGYIEGKNVVIVHRSAEGNENRLAELAAELALLKVDVIVALEPPALRAAREATKTIPIVMRSTGDPVEAGLISSLARPGGNITGVYSIAEELGGKWLELLKEVVPQLSRVAVLRNPVSDAAEGRLRKAELVAHSLGLQLQSVEARRLEEFDNAFRAATKTRAGGLITLRNPIFVLNRARLADLAVKYRLPAIYDDREFVDAGGLMSYGANLADLYRRAAVYVRKILKGAKPADLPVEQPTKFELIINLKTAKQIGLTIPPEVLARADKVIK